MAALVLSHDTALTYWKSAWIKHDEELLDAERSQRVLKNADCTVTKETLEVLEASDRFAGLPRPLDILVANRERRRNTSRARARAIETPLPDGSLVYAEHLETAEGGIDVCLCTPAFCFVQKAHGLDAIELACLGFELCSQYARDSKAEKGFYLRPPVATPEKIAQFAGSAPGMTGSKPARKIAELLIAGSKSPDETALALFAHLPRSLGGVGVPAPLLDQALEIPEEFTRLVGSRYLRPALVWPQIHVALEYDARDGNESSFQAEYLARKSRAYAGAGYELIELSRSDIENFESLRVCFERIARKLGKRRKPANAKQDARQRKTYQQLFGASADPGTETSELKEAGTAPKQG